MKKLNKTKFAILGLLTIKPLSGYDMKKIIKYSITYFWSESNGQLYPTLNRLMQEGLITLSNNQSNAKKISKIYSITPKGILELQTWLAKEQEEKSIHRDEGLLKLFFGNNISKKECIKLLENRKQRLFKSLDNFNKINKELKENSSSHYIYWRMALNNGISSSKSEINWCDESIKLLKTYKKDNL
jgi:PadR family transcriptional regulator, regulatory protein AphA